MLISTVSCTPVLNNDELKTTSDDKSNSLQDDIYTMPNFTVSGMTGSQGDTCIISFDEVAKVNTLVLEEKLLPLPNGVEKPSRLGVFSFSLWYKDGEEYKHFYTQDFIYPYRYCSFPTITTDEIKICIDDSSGLDWELTSVTPKFVEKTYNDNFDVAAYITFKSAYHIDNLDENHFPIIKTIYLAFIYFDENANIFIRDEYIGGQTIPGEELFSTVLSNVKAKASKDVKIMPVFVGRDFSGSLSTSDVHTIAMRDHKEKLANGIKTFIDTHNLDGVSFDYEYPEGSSETKVFYEFCTYLKTVLSEDQLVTGATNAWMFHPQNYMSYEVGKNIMSMDKLEMMAYDDKDEEYTDAYHSTFQNGAYKQYYLFKSMEGDSIAAEMVRELVYGDKDAVFPLSKINLGLPFFSRPLTMEEYWGDYPVDAEKLGKFSNMTTNEIYGPEYYNSWQMIYDKTTFCIDNGFGGVMVWQYICDLPMEHELSLFGAIKAAIESRK